MRTIVMSFGLIRFFFFVVVFFLCSQLTVGDFLAMVTSETTSPSASIAVARSQKQSSILFDAAVSLSKRYGIAECRTIDYTKHVESHPLTRYEWRQFIYREQL